MNLLDIQKQRRRSFLAATSGLASAVMLGEASAAGPEDLIVDTHMHTWSGDLERFPFAVHFTPAFSAKLLFFSGFPYWT